MKCMECSNIFNKNTHNQKFCTVQCSNRYRVRDWKRKKLKENKTKQQGFNRRSWEIMNLTIEEYTKGAGISKFKNNIRLFAQNWNPELKNKRCHICEYDKHIEYAHIKAIVSFDTTALLKEVNSPENLIQLCPNCHWEYDNGFFSIFKPRW